MRRRGASLKRAVLYDPEVSRYNSLRQWSRPTTRASSSHGTKSCFDRIRVVPIGELKQVPDYTVRSADRFRDAILGGLGVPDES